MKRWRLACAILLACTIFAPVGVSAAPRVAEVDATVDATQDPIAVRVQYAVTIDDASIRAMPLVALRAEGAQLRDVSFTATDGQPLEATVRESNVATDVSVALPANAQVGQRIEMVGTYAVGRVGQPTHLVVPILAPKWAPQTSAPRNFEATVSLPAGMTFVEGFPSTPAVGSAGNATTLTYTMSAVPSVIRADMTQGAAPFLTLQRALDLLAVLALIGAVIATYLLMRALRNQPATTETPAA